MGVLKPKVEITVSNKTIVRILAWVFGASLLLVFFGKIAHALTLIFAAFFLALALNPAVSRIMKRLPSRSRFRATGAAYLIVLTILITFFSLVIPPIARQTSQFLSNVPSLVQSFKDQDSAVSRFVERYQLDEDINNAVHDVSKNFKGVRPIVSTAGRIGATIASIIAVLVLTFMMLVEGPEWLEKIWKLTSPGKQSHRQELAHRMYKVVTSYVNGQLILATVASSFALIVMAILGVPNAIALAGILFLMGLVPLIGNITGAAIVVTFTLFSSANLAIIMAIYFLIYNQIDNATLQPYIQSRNNELTPLLVFVSALIGAGFGGLLGALVAIPAASCIKILVEDYIARKHGHLLEQDAPATSAVLKH